MSEKRRQARVYIEQDSEEKAENSFRWLYCVKLGPANFKMHYLRTVVKYSGPLQIAQTTRWITDPVTFFPPYGKSPADILVDKASVFTKDKILWASMEEMESNDWTHPEIVLEGK